MNGVRLPHAARSVPVLTALVTLAGLVGPAMAANLTVRVLDAAGQPVADVAVIANSLQNPGRTQALPPVEITQEKMRFKPALSIVTPGTRVRFSNRDSWDHHVRGSQGQSFEFRVAGAENPRKDLPSTGEVVLQGGAGPVQLNCLLHSSMQGSVYVSESPWYAITGADGSAQIDGVPEGAVEVVVWHGQQFVEQPPQRLQLAAGGASVNASLNFTPRRRR